MSGNDNTPLEKPQQHQASHPLTFKHVVGGSGERRLAAGCENQHQHRHHQRQQRQHGQGTRAGRHGESDGSKRSLWHCGGTARRSYTCRAADTARLPAGRPATPEPLPTELSASRDTDRPCNTASRDRPAGVWRCRQRRWARRPSVSLAPICLPVCLLMCLSVCLSV